MLRFGVTGTDTGVGKTTVASALVARIRQLGHRVAPMKPVETGVRSSDPGDAGRLIAAAGGIHRLETVSPVRLADPLAPTVAARVAGVEVRIDDLDRAFVQLTSEVDVVVVEGAGGLLVPIAGGLDFRTLFRRWNLEVIVVALNRLGVLNHVLLTVEAATSAGLNVRGIVLNTGATPSGDLAVATNRTELEAHVPRIPVVPFSPVSDIHSMPALAGAGAQLDSLIPELISPDGPDRPTGGVPR